MKIVTVIGYFIMLIVAVIVGNLGWNILAAKWAVKEGLVNDPQGE